MQYADVFCSNLGVLLVGLYSRQLPKCTDITTIQPAETDEDAGVSEGGSGFMPNVTTNHQSFCHIVYVPMYPCSKQILVFK